MSNSTNITIPFRAVSIVLKLINVHGRSTVAAHPTLGKAMSDLRARLQDNMKNSYRQDVPMVTLQENQIHGRVIVFIP